ncbi:MAG: hypothetical protein ACP5XB_12980 [Isosphaeraceae bacterium]
MLVAIENWLCSARFRMRFQEGIPILLSLPALLTRPWIVIAQATVHLGATREANASGEIAPDSRSRTSLNDSTRPRPPAPGNRGTKFIAFYRSAGREVLSRQLLIEERFAKEPGIAPL